MGNDVTKKHIDEMDLDELKFEYKSVRAEQDEYHRMQMMAGLRKCQIGNRMIKKLFEGLE